MNSGDIVGGEQGPAAQNEIVHHGDEEFAAAPTEVPPEEVVYVVILYGNVAVWLLKSDSLAPFESNVDKLSRISGEALTSRPQPYILHKSKLVEYLKINCKMYKVEYAYV